jgi:uncharacterized protein
MEFKTTALDLKAEPEGIISGYGAVFGNEDAGGDVIEPGAFAGNLGARQVKMLWQHRMDMPIGVWTEAAEDARGLRMAGALAMKTQAGRDAYELVSMGAVSGLSIGYRVKAFDRRGNGRLIKAVDLFEVSLVTMPMNEEAGVTGIKGAPPTVREFERTLNSLGFTNSAAKAIIASGYKGYLDSLRDAGDGPPQVDPREADELKATLQRILKGLKNV